MGELQPIPDDPAAPLAEQLARLRVEGATGVVAVGGGEAVRELVLVGGEVRAARSSAEGEKLGSWLVARGIITQEVKQLTLQAQGSGTAPPLGHLLVTRGVLGQDLLERELETLALTIVARAAARGTASFVNGQTQRQPDTLPNVSTQQVILHAARSLESVEVRRRHLARMEDGAVQAVQSVDITVHQVALDLPESVLLGKLHRPRAVAELAALSALPEVTFVRALYGLLVAGVVVPVLLEEAAPGPARPLDSRAPRAPEPEPGPPAPSAGGTPEEDQPAGASAPPRPDEDRPLDRAALQRQLNLPLDASHYAVLGVMPEDSYQEIFDAWEAFQARFGPAQSAHPENAAVRRDLERVFERGEEAFEMLSSPRLRPMYDRMLRTRTPKLARRDGGSHAIAEAAIEASPDPEQARAALVRANLQRAEELVRARDVFGAIRLLEQVCGMQPRPEHLVRLSQLMLLNPHWANRALDKLRRALELDPRYVPAWIELAEFWRRRKNREHQRKALEKALAADPGHAQARARYRELEGEAELQRLLERAGRATS